MTEVNTKELAGSLAASFRGVTFLVGDGVTIYGMKKSKKVKLSEVDVLKIQRECEAIEGMSGYSLDAHCSNGLIYPHVTTHSMEFIRATLSDDRLCKLCGKPVKEGCTCGD